MKKLFDRKIWWKFELVEIKFILKKYKQKSLLGKKKKTTQAPESSSKLRNKW